MNISFSKQQKLLLLFVILLMISFALFLQFFLLQPAKAELTSKQKTLQSEQRLGQIVAQKNAASNQTENVDTHDLQLKLPVKPLQAQFILDLQKVETMSNSEIKSMNFTNDQQAALQGGQTNPFAGMNQQQNTSTGTTTNGASSQGTAPGKQQVLATAPTGLEKLTVRLMVESPSYQDFEKFIENLEDLKRLTIVESIQYNGPNEATTINQNSNPFAYSLIVSAFYMINLTDLEKDLPKIDTPESAGKNDPLK